MSGKSPAAGLPEGLPSLALELAGEGVCIVDGADPEMPVVWVNPAFERLTGYAAEQAVGRNPRFLQGDEPGQPEVARMREAIRAGRAVSVTLRNYRPDGTAFWHALRLEPVEMDGHAWWVGFSRDVTGERRAGEEVAGLRERLGQVDPVDRVTGLHNVRRFEEDLARSWFVCAREGRTLALFTFSPDFFDIYAETFGPTASDSCLRMLGRAVSGCFRRASDAVGRTGEAEFCALALDMNEEQARAHAARVLERARQLAVHNPRAPAGRYMTLSAGVVVGAPGPEGGWESMLAGARQALGRIQGEGWERVELATGEEGG